MKIKLKGDFRIVNWNTANIESNINKDQHIVGNIDNDQRIVDTVMTAVKAINANVITLQELGSRTFNLLAIEFNKLNKKLKNEGKIRDDYRWVCYFQWFGLTGHATCVLGKSSWFNWEKLSGTRYTPSMDWWGYMQIELDGVMITNVHTRGSWAEKHVKELHKKISTGIIAGDFNNTNPGWNQTDIYLKSTNKNYGKIDHVLAVDEPKTVDGDVLDYYNSNHKLVIAGISFPHITKAATKSPSKKTLARRKPARRKPARRKPARRKPARRKPTTRKPARRKPTTRKPTTKRKTSSKRKIVKKLTKKTR